LSRLSHLRAALQPRADRYRPGPHARGGATAHITYELGHRPEEPAGNAHQLAVRVFPAARTTVRSDHGWLLRVERPQGGAPAALVPSAGSCAGRPGRDVEDAAATRRRFLSGLCDPDDRREFPDGPDSRPDA